jgi:hypothetical protein
MMERSPTRDRAASVLRLCIAMMIDSILATDAITRERGAVLFCPPRDRTFLGKIRQSIDSGSSLKPAAVFRMLKLYNRLGRWPFAVLAGGDRLRVATAMIEDRSEENAQDIDRHAPPIVKTAGVAPIRHRTRPAVFTALNSATSPPSVPAASAGTGSETIVPHAVPVRRRSRADFEKTYFQRSPS